MEIKIIFYVLLGIVWLFSQYRKAQQRKAAQAPRKPTATPAPQAPTMESLQDILKRAAAERQQQKQKQTERKSAAKPVVKSQPVKRIEPTFAERAERQTNLLGEPSINEGPPAVVDVHAMVPSTALTENEPVIDLRKAMLYQIILERPEY